MADFKEILEVSQHGHTDLFDYCRVQYDLSDDSFMAIDWDEKIAEEDACKIIMDFAESKEEGIRLSNNFKKLKQIYIAYEY